ncbi:MULTISPECIES: small ribosomal subunit Rsm22 family protein [Halorussus]|uniref:small ribosomal subunit Rsm22 family protein n=1 Tax=Halorussus TaxID=1070314 RepID=UPI0020A000DD|nr:methyltransferase domain-containing protein [Halorussus vallis]USZ76638.1 small ribosomal subunit Rsm22 family protein [Halorussus vallis]
MNADQRAGVVENAKYLRNVRPIDPEEVSEYVEGTPHPAVVRQVLREEAVSLGLVERDDGTFEPAEDELIRPTFRGVEAFPVEYGRRLEDLLVGRFGPNWHRGESGDDLRETIRRLKADYFENNPVEYDATAALGYAIYHLPDNYAAVQYVLDELGEKGLLDRRLRILDVGAGVGGPALGVHDYLPDDCLVEYDAVEPSAAADAFERLLADSKPNFHWSLTRETAEAFDPAAAGSNASGLEDDESEADESNAPEGDSTDAAASGEYDLILFANVLNELDDPEAVVLDYIDALADDGALVAVEPADRETSIGLRAVERAVADDRGAATVYSPTLRLWPGERPTDRGWSFDVKPDIDVPAFQRKLDEAAGAGGEFVNVDVQYSHSILRPDGKRRIEFVPDEEHLAKLADSERHVTKRIDLVAVKLSHSLSGEGANPLFKVGDGSESVDHFAVLTKETSLNRDLASADYGDLLHFEGGLLLWNDDEEAYNLVVDEETVVDRIPA